MIMISCTHTGGVGGGRRPGDVEAFTLLEVLVSMGIIIGALAGIAALLPATGARLAEATEIDRAGTMAANARADLANRRLISTALWSGSARAIVFGEGLANGATPTVSHSSIAGADAATLVARVSGTQFFLSDVTFTGDPPGICYGCMLSRPGAATGNPQAGELVRVSTVVFRKPSPEVKQFQLSPKGGGVFDIDVTRPTADVAADRRRFLQGCAAVLVVGTGEPRWFRIASSWTAAAPGQTSGMLAGTSSLALSGSGIPAGPLEAFGFDGLLRLEERFVNLE